MAVWVQGSNQSTEGVAEEHGDETASFGPNGQLGCLSVCLSLSLPTSFCISPCPIFCLPLFLLDHIPRSNCIFIASRHVLSGIKSSSLDNSRHLCCNALTAITKGLAQREFLTLCVCPCQVSLHHCACQPTSSKKTTKILGVLVSYFTKIQCHTFTLSLSKKPWGLHCSPVRKWANEQI